MTSSSQNGLWPVLAVDTALNAEQQFTSSCESFSQYPCNLNRTLTLENALLLYHDTLRDQSARLFNPCPQTKLLTFWETNRSGDGFEEFKFRDLAGLKSHCQERSWQDPGCRYVFIQSKNSRARLELTHDDFTYLASYHQVMPGFLDLVFTCGRQERPEDLHYTAFRYENYLIKEDQGSNHSLRMDRLGRSGRQIQHRFTLRSVERSGFTPGLAWSIRHTVAYHSFDVETGKSFWIFIKGNDGMEKRIKKATLSTRDMEMRAGAHQTLTGSFGASLTAHIQMMEWCGEQWRWYITEMEILIRDKGKDAVITDVDALARSTKLSTPKRLGNLSTPKIPKATTSKPVSFSPIAPSKLWGTLTGFSSATKVESNMLRSTHIDHISKGPEEIEGASGGDNDDDEVNLDNLLSFEKLQDLHKTGEYIQEALSALKHNCNIIRYIREHYTALMHSEDMPDEIKDGCRLDVLRFDQRATSIEKDLEAQQSRLEVLAFLLEDWSNLFFTAQQYANMQASKQFAMNAQAMTEKMHDIAVKTNNQTVSMHVITIFTLLFLPATFLATFFSSGILQWYGDDSDAEKAGSTYSWVTEQDRLFLFIEIVVPMMVLIIVAWLALYLRSKGKKNEEEQQHQQQQGLVDLEKGPEVE